MCTMQVAEVLASVQIQAQHQVMVDKVAVVTDHQVQQLRQQVTLQQERQILEAAVAAVFIVQVVEVDLIAHTLTVKQAVLV